MPRHHLHGLVKPQSCRAGRLSQVLQPPLMKERLERSRDGSKSSQLCHSWHKLCEEGASLAPLGKATL